MEVNKIKVVQNYTMKGGDYMPRIPKQHTASEILEVLQKQWLSTNDIRIISSTSTDRAREVKKEIAKKVIEEENCLLPNGLVPSDKVIKYFNLNIKHLKQMSGQ